MKNRRPAFPSPFLVAAAVVLGASCTLFASPEPVPADSGDSGAVDPNPSRRELKAIEKRGKLIVELDQFAAKATDAMYARGLRIPEGGVYICTKKKTGLKCAFGVLHVEAGEFAVSATVGERRTGGEVKVVQFREPRKEDGWLARAAAAISKAGSVFPFDSAAEAYNHVVVPEQDGAISVYFIPATSHSNVRVLGADGVVRVDAGGAAEVLRFHQALLVSEIPSDAGEYAAGAHTHSLRSAPNPLDVYYAMTAPGGAEYILGENWAFEVDHTGSIQPLGNTAAFIKKIQDMDDDGSTKK